MGCLSMENPIVLMAQNLYSFQIYRYFFAILIFAQNLFTVK